MALRVKKLTENASLPKRATEKSAGFDLYAAYDGKIPANGQAMIKTDLSIACPDGTYGRIAPRSGLAVKNSIDVGAGVVDADYRGNVGIILFNFSKEDFEVKKGDRIAQLILEKIEFATIEEVESLDETVRGEGGFGSTGVQEKENQNTENKMEVDKVVAEKKNVLKENNVKEVEKAAEVSEKVVEKPEVPVEKKQKIEA